MGNGRLMLALIVAASLLGGCGSSRTETGDSTEERTVTETAEDGGRVWRKLHITLDGRPSPENVAILMAESRGYFEDAGLEVEISPPEKPFRSIEYVAVGMVDLAISHQPQVVLAQEEELPVVAVGSVVAQPTAAMIWLEKSNIGGIGDLRGKTIAIPGVPFQEGLLESVLAQAGLTLADVKVEQVDYDLVPALAGGRADAIFGGSGNVEGVELESRGLKPVVTPVSDLGVPAYDELVLVTRPGRLRRHPQSIRDFIAAVARGGEAAIEDPAAAAEALAGTEFQAGDKPAREAVQATRPLLSRTGRMSPDRAAELVEWMRAQGLIQREVPVSALLTNRYLKQ